MKGFLRNIIIVLLCSVGCSVLYGFKKRTIPIRELVCQSDIIVVGTLHVYAGSAISLNTPAFDLQSKIYPILSYYDMGQIGSNPPKMIRIIKDDPWRNTVGVVNVVLCSTGTSHCSNFRENTTRDNNQWLWLLHRENLLNQYLVLKQLPLSEETTIVEITKKDKCKSINTGGR